MRFPKQLWIKPDAGEVPFDRAEHLLRDLTGTVFAFEKGSSILLTRSGELAMEEQEAFFPVVAYDMGSQEYDLGSREFMREHRLKYPYITGGMAHGIASAEIVTAMAKAGFMGFYGTGGLTLPEVEKAVVTIQQSLDQGEPYGVNIISVNPQHDQQIIDLLLSYGVRKIEVAGAITLSPAIVEYRLKGAHRDGGNRIVVPNTVFAKVSREEVAVLFMSPPPQSILDRLLNAGRITEEEALLAQEIPVAQEIIAEADSGGHTDNRPAILLFQNMANFRDQLEDKYRYNYFKIRIGAAGGICTPQTVLAAFVLGADFVVTGSINQSCLEADTSPVVKKLLSQMLMSDVSNAPSADMFEMGSKVQVMTRSLMFHLKANKLYELYQSYKSLDEIPEKLRQQLEERTFRDKLDNIWSSTKEYYMRMSPEVIDKAEKNPRYKMALVFKWYLGLSSRWAQQGEMDRNVDFQIMCGPGMGAFNRWVKGSYLEAPENRRVVDVALNLMEGARYLKRIQSFKDQGVNLPPDISRAIPTKRSVSA